MNECLQGVIDAAKSVIPANEMKEFIKKVQERTKDTVFPQDLQKIIGDYHAAIDAAVKNKNYNAQLNALRKKSIVDFVSGDNPARKFSEFLRTGKESVGYRQLTYQKDFLGMLESALTPSEFKMLQGGLSDVEIAEDAKFHNSSKKEITELNKKLKDIFSNIRTRLNSSGAMIGEREGWLGRQAHNPESLKKMDTTPAAEMNKMQKFFQKYKKAMSIEERFNKGFERWKDFVKPRIDFEASNLKNASGAERETWLKEFYANINSGVHKSLADSAPNIFGGGSILKRINAQRKMIFKDPKSEVEYAKEYGYGNLYQNILRNLEKSANDAALLDTFGSNPEHMFETIKQEQIVLHKKNEPMVRKLQSRKLQAEWETVSGHYKMTIDNGMAKGFANARGYYSLSRFSGSPITAFWMDPIGRAVALKNNHGVPWLQALFQGYTESFKYAGGNKEEIKNMTNAYVRHTLGGIQSRLGMDTMPAKTVAKLQDFTFRYNGLHALDRARSEGVAMAEGNSMANNLRKIPFDKLNESTRNTYKIYGIDEPEYKALKNALFRVDKDGEHYIFADSIAKMTDASVKEYAASRNLSVYKARNELQFKVSNYQRDAIGCMIMDAKDPTMRFIYNYFGGPGTLGGELMRTALLGKSWGIQYTYRIIDPLIMKGSWGNKITNVAALTIWSTLMSYMAIQTRNLASGKKVDDLSTPKNLYKAFSESDAIGQYSALFSNYIENPEELMPLMIKSVSQLLKIPYDAVADYNHGEAQERAQLELFKWISSNSPLINMPIVKLLVDHAILYKAQEMIAPGSIENLEYNSKEHGDQYWWSPTSNIPDSFK